MEEEQDKLQELQEGTENKSMVYKIQESELCIFWLKVIFLKMKLNLFLLIKFEIQNCGSLET